MFLKRIYTFSEICFTSAKDKKKKALLLSYFRNLKNVIKVIIFSIVIGDIFDCLYYLF